MFVIVFSPVRPRLEQCKQHKIGVISCQQMVILFLFDCITPEKINNIEDLT